MENKRINQFKTSTNRSTPKVKETTRQLPKSSQKEDTQTPAVGTNYIYPMQGKLAYI